MPFQRRCYLALRGPPCIEHDGVDLRPQISKDRLNISNGRIDEEDFCWASHDHIFLFRVLGSDERRLKFRATLAKGIM